MTEGTLCPLDASVRASPSANAASSASMRTSSSRSFAPNSSTTPLWVPMHSFGRLSTTATRFAGFLSAEHFLNPLHRFEAVIR